MAIPDYQTLMLPLLKLAAEGETRVPDIEDRLANYFDLSEDERGKLLPSGRQTVFRNRMHWAKFYLGKAGLIDFPRRGHFVATEAAHQLLSRGPERIDNDLLMEYPGFREFLRGNAGSGGR